MNIYRYKVKIPNSKIIVYYPEIPSECEKLFKQNIMTLEEIEKYNKCVKDIIKDKNIIKNYLIPIDIQYEQDYFKNIYRYF
jgi:hypothetical protein